MRLSTKDLKAAGIAIEMDGKPLKGDFILDLWGKVEISDRARDSFQIFVEEMNLGPEEHDELIGIACDFTVFRTIKAVATHPV